MTDFGIDLSNKRPKIQNNGRSEQSFEVRQFKTEDASIVQRICYEHFRSTSFSAVSYYIASHIDDMLFLTILALFLMPLRNVLLAVVLFNLYLFCKSRFEVEHYIIKHCTDLKNIADFYLDQNNGNNFWVAELFEEQAKLRLIVGCIGLIEQDAMCGKVVRLIVSSKHRRLGIGSELLQHLEKFTRERKYESLFLYTNSLNPSHANFVTQHGYYLISTIPRGLMRGDLLIWKYIFQAEKTETVPEVPLVEAQSKILD